jgi:hypothetical protein
MWLLDAISCDRTTLHLFFFFPQTFIPTNVHFFSSSHKHSFFFSSHKHSFFFPSHKTFIFFFFSKTFIFFIWLQKNYYKIPFSFYKHVNLFIESCTVGNWYFSSFKSIRLDWWISLIVAGQVIPVMKGKNDIFAR